jgi:hypothetical protein
MAEVVLSREEMGLVIAAGANKTAAMTADNLYASVAVLGIVVEKVTGSCLLPCKEVGLQRKAITSLVVCV